MRWKVLKVGVYMLLKSGVGNRQLHIHLLQKLMFFTCKQFQPHNVSLNRIFTGMISVVIVHYL